VVSGKSETMSEPADSDIHVTCCLTAALDDGTVRSAVDQLSAEERRRHDRFHFPRDRRDFAAAHALLRRALSSRGERAPREWTFTTNAHGKPALVSPSRGQSDLCFNLSHTNGLVACVTAHDAALGIDVEKVDRPTDALDLARRFFSPTEIALLEREPPPERQERFIETWTLKEAYVKAIGEGLSHPLREFAFVPDGPASLRFETTRAQPTSPWQFVLFAPSHGYRMAVAVGGPLAPKRRIVVRVQDPAGREQLSEAVRPLRSSVD
jgi:4'-phosphopantetheinyl transferase